LTPVFPKSEPTPPNVSRYPLGMGERKHPLEIVVIIYLGGLDSKTAAKIQRKGYRIAKILLASIPETLLPNSRNRIFILEEDTVSHPRIVVEIAVSYNGLSETEKFRTRGIAHRIRRLISERLKQETETKISLRER